MFSCFFRTNLKGRKKHENMKHKKLIVLLRAQCVIGLSVALNSFVLLDLLKLYYIFYLNAQIYGGDLNIDHLNTNFLKWSKIICLSTQVLAFYVSMGEIHHFKNYYLCPSLLKLIVELGESQPRGKIVCLTHYLYFNHTPNQISSLLSTITSSL